MRCRSGFLPAATGIRYPAGFRRTGSTASAAYPAFGVPRFRDSVARGDPITPKAQGTSSSFDFPPRHAIVARMFRIIWRLLEKNGVYKAFRNWVGTEDFFQHLVTRWQRAEPGMRVLDLGCGTGDALLRLPETHYVGIDFNRDYIAMCQQRFGAKGTFMAVDLATEELPFESEFDLALLYGVLHHIDDAGSLRLLQTVHKALRPGGRLITLDGVFHEGQRPLTRWMVARDRGRHVREEQAYLDLARSVFPVVNHEVTEGRIRIPYSHLIMECCREPA